LQHVLQSWSREKRGKKKKQEERATSTATQKGIDGGFAVAVSFLT